MSVLFQNDFDDSQLDQESHRPFPKPDAPWFMTQTWNDVLFLHWPVNAAMLQALLPAGLEVDLYLGQAYVAVTPFHMTNVSPRGLPAVPRLSNMPETNVRTYVIAKGIPGVYFFSLDAANAFVVGAARTMFHLPYYTADMHTEERDGWIHYRTRRISPDSRPAELRGRYRTVGIAEQSKPGSLEYFLTERYCLYSYDDSFYMYRAHIHHGPWKLTLADVELDVNTMADAAGIRLPGVTQLAHYARRQDTVVWPLQRVDD